MFQVEAQTEIIFKTVEADSGWVFGSCRRCDFFGRLPFVQESRASFEVVKKVMENIHSLYVTEQGTKCPCMPTIDYDGPQQLK
jgi:hypothetical protein